MLEIPGLPVEPLELDVDAGKLLRFPLLPDGLGLAYAAPVLAVGYPEVGAGQRSHEAQRRGNAYSQGGERNHATTCCSGSGAAIGGLEFGM